MAKKRGEYSTLRDVAEDAGVSVKTASRVLNNDPLVADSTRELVIESMNRLDYRPNLAARSLSSGKDHTVGIIVDTIGDSFFAELAAEIERVLDKAGYRVLIASSNREVNRERELVQEFLQRRCSGLIVAPSKSDSLKGINTQSTPIVFVDRRGKANGAVSVVVDDFALSREVTEHLVHYGHKRIAFLSDLPTTETTKDRIRGYRHAMKQAGIEIDETLVRTDCPDPADVHRVIQELLSLPQLPTALISTNTRLSMGVVPELKTLPQSEQLAFVSFGDFAMAESLSPGITAVNHSPITIGKVAANELLSMLSPNGESRAASVETVIVNARLIPRGSGELRPALK